MLELLFLLSKGGSGYDLEMNENKTLGRQATLQVLVFRRFQTPNFFFMSLRLWNLSSRRLWCILREQHISVIIRERSQ